MNKTEYKGYKEKILQVLDKKVSKKLNHLLNNLRNKSKGSPLECQISERFLLALYHKQHVTDDRMKMKFLTFEGQDSLEVYLIQFETAVKRSTKYVAKAELSTKRRVELYDNLKGRLSNSVFLSASVFSDGIHDFQSNSINVNPEEWN